MLAHELHHALVTRGVKAHLAKRSECDITNNDQLAGLFERHRPSLLLNCAAHTGVDACEEEPDRANSINGQGPANLARLCSLYSAKFVHFSTDFVFNGQS